MSSLLERIAERNNKFTEETNAILTEYKEKLGNVFNGLMNNKSKPFEIDWKFINTPEGDTSGLVFIHGMLEMQEGTSLFDPDLKRQVTINSKNKGVYLNYIKIMVSAEKLEQGSVEDIIKTIREIQKSDTKMTEEEFNKMQPPRTKH